MSKGLVPPNGFQDGHACGRALTLTGPAGSELTVTEHGGHAIRWKPRSGEEWLFLSPLAEFTGSKSIRGGVPVVFPQFAELGALPKHGLLRDKPWTLLDASESEVAIAHLQIEDDEATRKCWPHSFRVESRFELGADQLKIGLTVTNTGTQAFRFTSALHTYFRVDDIAAVRIGGLKGLSFRDSANGGGMKRETEDALAIIGEVDRIYFAAQSPIGLSEGNRRLRVESSGFVDAVIWNPGPIKAAGLRDLDEGGWRRFVCIESAVIDEPIDLAPGQQWQGSQTLTDGQQT